MVLMEGLKVYLFVSCAGMGEMLSWLISTGVMSYTDGIFKIASKSFDLMPVTDYKGDDRRKKKLA